jgi:hypothetical protein
MLLSSAAAVVTRPAASERERPAVSVKDDAALANGRVPRMSRFESAAS